MRKLESKPENIVEVERIAAILAKKYAIGPEVFPNLLISLTEAVNNAIHHGNNCDENKYVFIQTTCAGGRLLLKVSDEGPGFDPNNIPDPRAENSITDCDGRGVFLMRALCDCLEYHDSGRTVEMTFHLKP
jgi:serine/threonine-protein kinase RsbW